MLLRLGNQVRMQAAKQHCMNSTELDVEAKAEPKKDGEKTGDSARMKPNRARLLRRCTSQCLLLNENQKDISAKIKQDSTISSSTSGLLFTRPLSSSTGQQSRPSFAFHRPKSSRPISIGASRRKTASNTEDRNTTEPAKSKPASSQTKTSVPSLRRRSSYFSLQSIQRSLSQDGSNRRLTKRGSREEKDRRSSRSGFVTSIDEDEREERRQLVMYYQVIENLPEVWGGEERENLNHFTLQHSQV